jgi:hypothetical protein
MNSLPSWTDVGIDFLERLGKKSKDVCWNLLERHLPLRTFEKAWVSWISKMYFRRRKWFYSVRSGVARHSKPPFFDTNFGLRWYL